MHVTVTSETEREGEPPPVYTRVFNSILDSSINLESVPSSAKWLWIVMLVIANQNRNGVVDMPVERLAARAGQSLSQTQAALEFLSSPDDRSRSEAEEGRRIVPIRDDSSRGWLLVNWEYYAGLARAEEERESTRRRVAEFRARKKSGNATVTESNALPVDVQVSESEMKLSSTDGRFAVCWSVYPRKIGKTKAEKSFRSQIKTVADFEAFRQAIENYKRDIATLGVAEKYIKYGSTFFHEAWRDYVPGTWRPASAAPAKPKPDPNANWRPLVTNEG